ncbi:hypothetical protein NG895_20065 [Aeoliella sp. ICT_H6.2]|uniref:Tetratricopeptide repeat protein n=1 Tax=Aeoliella straminimaris TaxID=2954799 RepID=A0A9X2JKB3_9BACT|nr:hypothetical protein [Aeoliella straminimaris]MCO6046199.1 hypothetical protein [Aeoliella straminimaris]
MALMNWIRSKWSMKYRATWMLRRGILHARAGRTSEAMQKYSEVLDLEGVTPNTRAMALYNRALLQSADGKADAAADDLNKILQMTGASQEVMTEARRKLTRMSRSSDRMTTRSNNDSSESNSN